MSGGRSNRRSFSGRDHTSARQEHEITQHLYFPTSIIYRTRNEQDDSSQPPAAAEQPAQAHIEAPSDFRHLEESRKGIQVMPVEPAQPITIVDEVGGLPAPEPLDFAPAPPPSDAPPADSAE